MISARNDLNTRWSYLSPLGWKHSLQGACGDTFLGVHPTYDCNTFLQTPVLTWLVSLEIVRFLTGATFLFLPFLYILLKVAAEVHSCCLTRYNSNSVQVYEELVQWWLKGCAFISPWQLSREWFAYAFSKGFFGTCIRLGRIVFYSTRRVPRFNTL